MLVLSITLTFGPQKVWYANGGRSSFNATFVQLCLALEGLTECLVSELDPAWNIKVIWHPLVHLDHTLTLVPFDV